MTVRGDVLDRVEADDDVTPVRIGGTTIFVGLPTAEGRMLGELLVGTVQRKAWDAYYEPRNAAFRAAKLEGLMVQVTQKAGVDGRLFGSVGNYDIVEALEKQGIEIERSQVRMPQGPLKQVGDYPVQVVLHSDVVATITVSVLGEA